MTSMRSREAALIVTATFSICLVSVWPMLDFGSAATFSGCFLLAACYSAFLSRRLWHDNDRLRSAAERDPLTGLLNRRALDDAITAATALPAAQRGPRSMLVLDIDHFKLINDRFGHSSGDQCLRRIARLIQTDIAQGAAFYRFVGEEFVLRLDCPREQALKLAERLRALTERSRLLREKDLHITVSIGVAELGDGESSRSWFQRADAAMYQAKSDGRNRVCAAH